MLIKLRTWSCLEIRMAGHSYGIKVDNSFFEEEEFKYLETTLTHQNYVREEIKSRLKSGSAWYFVQNLLCSSLLSKM
jgi:hypothetical protein